MALAGWVEFDRRKFLARQKQISNRALSFIAIDLQRKIRRKLLIQRKNKPHSLPGEPPRIDKVTSPLKKLVAWSIDKKRGIITVGPMLFRDSKNKASSTVPNILEHGGQAMVEDRVYNRNAISRRGWGRKGYFKTPAARRRATNSPRFREWKNMYSYAAYRPVQIKPRPFVGVSLREYIDEGGVEKAVKRAAEWGRSRR